MTAIQIPPNRLPGLAPLLNGDLWKRWESDGRVFPVKNFASAVRYVRLKPETSCRIAVFNGWPGTYDDPPPGFLLHLYPQADRARTAFSKEGSRRHLIGSRGYRPFLCEKNAVVAVPFPNDPGIPGLRHFYRPHRARSALTEALGRYPEPRWKIRRELEELVLLAYKPGRRAVYRAAALITCATGEIERLRLHLKLENPTTCALNYEKLVSVHKALARDAGWRVPEPLGWVASRSLVVAEWVDGSALGARLGSTGELDALRRTGRALAEFQQLDVRRSGLPRLLPGERLFELAQDLAQLLPGQESRLLRLAERLVTATSRLSAGEQCLVHGDFHTGQVLLERDRPVLVDFDQAGLGHAARDVGSFLADLEEQGAPSEAGRAFVEGYNAARGGPLDPWSISICMAAAAFRRAIFPMRELDPQWPGHVRARLARIEAGLERWVA